jgi:predicted glycosyl hydrolase (DUF1957 family)
MDNMDWWIKTSFIAFFFRWTIRCTQFDYATKEVLIHLLKDSTVLDKLKEGQVDYAKALR